MRSDAKASSAGSTSGQGASLGSFVRGAFAIRGASEGADGSGAPANGLARFRLLALFCVAVTAALAIYAAPALAAQTRPYTGTSIGPVGAALPGNFSRLESIFVDQSSGDIYVFDAVEPGATTKGKIFKFNAAGEPLNFSGRSSNTITGVQTAGYVGQSQIAVAPAGSPGGTAGDIYIANSNTDGFVIYSPAGVKLGEMQAGPNGTTPCGVTVNPAGHVFISYVYFGVAGVEGPGIAEYTPSTNPLTAADEVVAARNENVCQLAADGLGNVYVARNEAVKLEGGVAASPTLLDPRGRGLAVDPITNDVYVNRASSIAEYDSSGALVGRFGANQLTSTYESNGIAVNGNSNKVYVGSGTKGRVVVFGAPVLVPDATTEEATGVAPNDATLHGEVGAAGGPAASCEFQYVTRSGFEAERFANATQVPCSPPGPFTGSADEAVSATLTGLTAGTSYVYRLVGKNTNGENLGDALEFRTGEAVNLETNQPTVVTATSARLNGSITPEGAEIEECVFEWGPQQTPFVNTTPCAESSLEIGTGSEPKAVHANLTGLEVGKSYLFRLRAKNHFGTRRGNEVYFSALGPGILGESASGSDTTVTATACIASRGEETSYVVEYVSDAEFAGSGYANAQSVPIGGKVVEENCTVTQQIAGLTPATKYHLRFAATSAAGTAHGEDTVFSTLRSASAGLPDGRAYEQVSPPSKNGSNVQGDYLNILYASPNGDANTFYSGSGAGETESSQALPIYASSRGTSNWSTEGINPPSSLGARLRILTYKEDLSGSYAITWEARGAATLYLREKGGHLVKIASGLKLGAGLDEEKVGGAPERTNIAAESAGGSEVLFESPVKLAEGAIEGQLQQEGRPLIENLYIWDRGTGGIDLVSVLPGGTPAPEGATAGSYNWANGGAGGATGAYLTKDTLSQDGGVAVFTTMDSSHQIYARRDPLSATATTVHVSASQKTNGAGPGGTDPLGPAAAVYEGMTPDGHYIFFKSSEELTNDAYTGPADEGEDLYRYDVNSGQLTDVAPHPSGKGTDVLGIAGFSNDGSVVYLVAQGALATGGTVGAPNIYAVEGGTVRFVSTLGGSNAPDRENWIGMGILSAEVLIQKQSKVSNDGNDLLFTSTKSNPGYDSNGFTEVYRYELSSESLNCMSCNPAGFKATSGASLQAIPTPFVSAETWNPLGTRNLSADGKRAFFDTREALLSSDINGVNDVYEWEADGSGSCHSTADNGGCLFLVSSGTSPSASYFSDASASGDDVFFLTAQKLVGQDKDELVDSYDARVGGGLAAQNPPPPNPCSGEACLGSAGTAPAAQSPGSANFSGPENPKPSHKKKHQKKKKKSRNKSHGKSKAKHGQSGGHR